MRHIGDAIGREQQRFTKRQRTNTDASAAASLDGPLPARVDSYLPSKRPIEVLAMCVEVRVVETRRFARTQVYLTFKIIEGEHTGKVVWGVCNYPDRPWPGSKYYDSWCIANEGPPARRDRMTPRR